MKKLKRLSGIFTAIIFTCAMYGCSSNGNVSENTEAEKISNSSASVLSEKNTSDFFSDFDLNSDYDTLTAEISLNDENTAVSGNGVDFKDNILSITNGGTFLLSGTLTNGQIYVNTEENVHIVLNNVNITHSSTSPFYIENAKNVCITLAENSENTLTDGKSYTYNNSNENEPDAVIFSKDDLSINGKGSLTINANYNEGITTKNDLRIAGGNISVTAVGNGIKGKDSVVIRETEMTINSGKDGIKSSNSEETDKGYIFFESGTFNITAGNDAIQSENYLTVADGTYNLKTGDGCDSVQRNSFEAPINKNNNSPIPRIPTDENGEIQIPQMPDGDFQPPQMPTDENGEIQTPQMPDDDFQPPQMPENSLAQNNTNENTSTESENTSESQKGFKSEKGIIISGGNITSDCADDCIHSAQDIQINSGKFNLSSGDDAIHSDNNINITNGNITVSQCYEGIEGIEINIDGGNIDITASDDGMNASDGTSDNADPMASSPDCKININGGNIIIDAGGDGIDSNGSITINDGNIIVEGSESGADSPLDSGTDITVNGGTLLAVGSSEMLEIPSDKSTQNVISAVADNQQDINTKILLQDKTGNEIISHSLSKKCSAIIISSPLIETNCEYSISFNDELFESFTVSDIITSIGNSVGIRGNMPDDKGEFNRGHGFPDNRKTSPGFPSDEKINPFDNKNRSEEV